ncbi:equilibrative nucleobase transporter 1-like [Physella acuta]|uniref:equilibrative nucleobase transporter 1-like n=1 Tax=Physella acuta TaxID=109671 RepID=UPI0027DCFCC0|nr:equilibrative nucleobase transporter 1-like [Physella acuta]
MFFKFNTRLRFLYAIWAFLECLGFCGLLQGWGSLVYILKDEGIYSDLCVDQPHNGSTDSNVTRNTTEDTVKSSGCLEQDSKLAAIFTIASSLYNLISIVLGQFSFKFGTRTTRFIGILFYVSGALMLAFTSKELPWLAYPGLTLIGFGGVAMYLTCVQVAHLFPLGGSVVIGFLNGAFDTSSGIQLMVKFGYESGISRRTSYVIVACSQVFVLVSTLFFYPKDFIRKHQQDHVTEIKQENTELDTTKGLQTEAEKDLEQKTDTDTITELKDTEDSGTFRGLLRHVLSLTFILHVMWASCLQLRFYFVLGSINTSLEKMVSSQSEVSHYTNVMLYTMMTGIFVSPIAGFFYSWLTQIFANSVSSVRRQVMPSVLPLAATTVFSVIMSSLLLVNDPRVLYAFFVFLVLQRSFLYTMYTAYIAAIFPSCYLGSLLGIAIFTSGVISFFQYALFAWLETGGLSQVNIFLLVLACVTLVHPLYQWWACRRAEVRQLVDSNQKITRQAPH